MWRAWILQYTRRTGVLHTMGESIYQSWLWHILNMVVIHKSSYLSTLNKMSSFLSTHYHPNISWEQVVLIITTKLPAKTGLSANTNFRMARNKEMIYLFHFLIKTKNGRTCKDEQVLLFVLLILGSLWETCSSVRAVPTPAWQRKAREDVITLNDKTTKLQTKNMQTANHKKKGDELLHYHPPLLQDWGPRLKPIFKIPAF